MNLVCKRCGGAIGETNNNGTLSLQLSTKRALPPAYGPEIDDEPRADQRFWFGFGEIPDGELRPWCVRHGERPVNGSKVRTEHASGNATMRV